MTENKYHLAFHKWLTKYKYKLCWASQKEGLQDQFWVSQGDAKFVEPSDDWSWLQMQTAPNPYDSPDVALVYEDDMQFWQRRVLKEKHSPTNFFRGLVDPVIKKSESAVTNFHVPIYEWLGPTHQKYQCWAKYV